MPLAQHHQKMKMSCGPGAIFKIDAHAARAAPSEDENGARARRYFQDSKCCILYNKNGGITPLCGSMLHFVQHFERCFRVWDKFRPNCCTKYNITLLLVRRGRKMLYFLQDSSPYAPGKGPR